MELVYNNREKFFNLVNRYYSQLPESLFPLIGPIDYNRLFEKPVWDRGTPFIE